MALIDLPPVPTLPRPLRPLPGLQALRRRVANRRARERLAQLDDHLLDDIGLTRAQAERGTQRPGWNPPAHWRQRW